MDWIVEAYNEPDPNPYAFEVGQVIRVRLGRSDDGQTPERWNGAICTVEGRYCTGIHKEHWYKVRHSNNFHSCEFVEDSLDQRYARWPKQKQPK